MHILTIGILTMCVAAIAWMGIIVYTREMVAVVHGFPTKFHALQCTSHMLYRPSVLMLALMTHCAFSLSVYVCHTVEYAWQHPYNSRFTKERLCLLKGRVGVGTPRSLKRKLIELHELLQLQPWTHFPLTVSYTSECAFSLCIPPLEERMCIAQLLTNAFV